MKLDSATEIDFSEEARRAPERSRADTSRRLLAAGTELFASRGLQPTTTVQIATRAGVAVGTFYLHFRDKRELFREIVREAFARLRGRLAAAAPQPGDDAASALRAQFDELLRFAEANRNLVRVLFGRDHEAAELGEELFDDFLPGVERGLGRGIAEGRAQSLHAAVAAQGLVAMWTRVVAWWVEDPSRASREEVVETLVRLHPFASGG